MIMISTKNFIKMAKKWQKIAAQERKRISFQRRSSSLSRSNSVAEKGHFVIYTVDHRRFMLPLEYLNHNIFRELLKMAEEEFGLSSDGPITLPCDSIFLSYVISLVRRGEAHYEVFEKVLLNSISSSSRCSLLSTNYHFHQRPLVSAY